MPIEITFKKFPLIYGSKHPDCPWKNSESYDIKLKHENHGIPTGKINGITVVDLDIYKDSWKNNHLFISEFGENYINNFNTFTVKTPKGGIHLYFKYNELIRTTQNKNFEIDIRNDDGFVVGTGSQINGTKYTVYNDCSIKKMPKKLVEWLVKNIHKISMHKFIKQKQYEVSSKPTFKYLIPKEELEEIIKLLPKEYFISEKWFIFTTFCKIMNAQDLWDKYSRLYDNYNETENLVRWNSINKGMNYSIVEEILKITGQLDKLSYFKLKPIPSDTKQPHSYINKQKLGYDYIKYGKNLVIKSDTGTGKTTSFKHFIKNTDSKFISIVSRQTLANEQYTSFVEHGISCQNYLFERLNPKKSVVIQIDSLMKIANYDFSDKIIFMDEFNSIIEYLVTSTTLANNRINIFKIFMKIIKECKQIVCVDADISNICFKVLDYIGKAYEYHINEYKHNLGRNAYEIKTRHQLIDLIKNDNEYLIACDSRTECKNLYDELVKLYPDKPIKLYCSDMPKHEKVDFSFPRIIYSPKIIYGIDSTMHRNVYCLYTSHSISPRAMVQQVNRCRDIKNLYYFFINRSLQKVKYIDLDDCKKQLLEKETYDHNFIACDFLHISVGENQLYIDLLATCTYINDCYGSNKFLHFKNIIQSRGFIDNNEYFRVTMPVTEFKERMTSATDMKKRDRENFNPIDQKNKDINDYLNIPSDQIEKFKEYFIDPIKLKKHFLISDFFFKINNTNKTIKEFKSIFLGSEQSKLCYIMNLKNQLNIQFDEKNNQLSFKDDLFDDEYNKINMDYNHIFNATADFKKNASNLIVGIFKDIFGSFIINKGRKNKNVFLLNTKSLNDEYKLYCKRAIEIRDFKCVLKDFNCPQNITKNTICLL